MPTLQEILASKLKQKPLEERGQDTCKAFVKNSTSKALEVPLYFLFLTSDMSFSDYVLLSKYLSAFALNSPNSPPLPSLSLALLKLYQKRLDPYSAIFKLQEKMRGIGIHLSTEQQEELLILIEEKG